MTDKQIIIDAINSNQKCDKSCIVHNLVTHNGCITCKAIKDSPYLKEYIKDKSDEEIVNEIIETLEEYENG